MHSSTPLSATCSDHLIFFDLILFFYIPFFSPYSSFELDWIKLSNLSSVRDYFLLLYFWHFFFPYELHVLTVSDRFFDNGTRSPLSILHGFFRESFFLCILFPVLFPDVTHRDLRNCISLNINLLRLFPRQAGLVFTTELYI
jgi:hypothetical protein